MSGNPVKGEFAKLAGRFFEHGAQHEGDDAPWCHLEAYPFEPDFDPAGMESNRLIAKAGLRAETHSFICMILPLSKNAPWGILLLQKSSGRGEIYGPFKAYMELAKRAGLLLARLPREVIRATGECLERYFDEWEFTPFGVDRAWTALAWYVSQQPGQQDLHYVSSTAIYVNPFLASADMIDLCGFDGDEPAFPASTKRQGSKSVKDKRSTTKGSANAKIIAGLTKHHKYADDGALNQEPIQLNKFAKKLGVSSSTVSDFIGEKFGGYDEYRAACRDTSNLINSLKLLNNEYAPRLFLERDPGARKDRNDDE